jgi:iron complex outermembrane recepter protein
MKMRSGENGTASVGSAAMIARQKRDFCSSVVSGLVGVLISAAATTPALAKDAADASASAAASQIQPAGTLEEVVVTARLRHERLQDVPIAITVLTKKNIEDRGIKTIGDIANYTPNVNFTDALQLGAPNLTIRGQTQQSYKPPPAAIVVDGVLEITPAQFDVDEFGMQQVEVLKGPQGAIYGVNAIAGAIIINTVKPGSEFKADAQTGYASGDDRTAKGYASGPVIPGLLYVLGGVSYDDRRGQVQNVTTGSYSDKFKDTTARLRAVLTPTDNTDLDIKYTHSNTHGRDPQYIVSASGNPSISSDPFNTAVVGQNPRTLNELSGVFDWDASLARTTATLAYVNVLEGVSQELNDTPIDLAYGTQLQRDLGFSQDLRFTSRSRGPWKWMIGGYHVRYSSRRDTDIYADPVILGLATVPTSPSILLGADGDLTYQTDWAGFGDLSYDITSRFTLDVEARYDDDTAEQFPRLSGVTLPTSQTAKFSKWQPKGSLTYKATSTLTFYASVGEGFRIGDFNPSGRTFGNNIINAESATNYEVGAKMALLDRRLVLNSSLFQTDVDNSQFEVFDLAAGTDVGLNINKERIRGLEIESVASITDYFGINASIGYTDAEIEQFVPPIGFEGTASDYIGKEPTRVPKVTGNVGFDVSVPVADGISAFLRPQYRYTGHYYWDPLNQYERPAENTLDVRVGLSGRSDRWDATAYVTNALNEKITQDYEPVTITGSPFGTDVYYPPVGAIYGFQLNYRWD